MAWLPIILAFGVIAAACGGDDDASTGGGGSASGSINISGSSTVEPISSLAAEAFMSESGDVDIAVDGPGTGDGFELFCNGETEISDASRAIKQEEADICAENGVEYVELQVAYDGMAVMTSVDNDQVECLSFPDLYALIGPEAEGVDNWADAEAVAGELGSTTDLPDAELALSGP
ncbi:MAG: substrate-binding domain-containing protein, partial [Acidimicrobiales bacterium]|nr:substrate-binding domain-containing protein [Acidimicrobiales bacterium]